LAVEAFKMCGMLVCRKRTWLKVSRRTQSAVDEVVVVFRKQCQDLETMCIEQWDFIWSAKEGQLEGQDESALWAGYTYTHVRFLVAYRELAQLATGMQLKVQKALRISFVGHPEMWEQRPGEGWPEIEPVITATEYKFVGRTLLNGRVQAITHLAECMEFFESFVGKWQWVKQRINNMPPWGWSSTVTDPVAALWAAMHSDWERVERMLKLVNREARHVHEQGWPKRLRASDRKSVWIN
jgi:hypothetical protein